MKIKLLNLIASIGILISSTNICYAQQEQETSALINKLRILIANQATQIQLLEDKIDAVISDDNEWTGSDLGLKGRSCTISENIVVCTDGYSANVMGDQGDQGHTGEKGNPGPKGIRGKPGSGGDRGKRGDKGATGDRGDRGRNGKATYRGGGGHHDI